MVAQLVSPPIIRGAAGPRTAKAVIDALGIGTSLVLCLDPGDVNCTNGTAQQWTDVSGLANHYNRGTTSGAEASDPTFVGTAGSLLDTTYFNCDGGDFFTPVAATTFDDPWHKDGATFTWAVIMQIPAGANQRCIMGNPGSSGPSCELRLAMTSGSLGIANWTGSAQAITQDWGPITAVDDQFSFFSIALSENGGAGASHWNVNGSITTFNGAYSSPSASNPVGSWQIGRRNDNAQIMPNGTRYGPIALWNRVLSQTELDSYRLEMKKRFPLI